MDHAVKALMSSSPGRERLLQLNNDNARETSHLTDEKFVSMIESACVATVIEPALAFMLAFDQDDRYDGGHFQWFRQRLDHSFTSTGSSSRQHIDGMAWAGCCTRT